MPLYNDIDWAKADYPLNKKKMNSPDYAVIWCRKTIIIKRDKAKKDYVLDLGMVEMEDSTYFNGHMIGSSRNFHKSHIYKVLAQYIKPGKNVIAIRLVSQWGGVHLGSQLSNPLLFSADTSDKISLVGAWRYNHTLEKNLPVAKEFQNNISALYNAMVNPIIPYAIKGILWYQGESNINNGYYYRNLISLLLNDWRIRWQQGQLPFLLVQLPAFSYTTSIPTVSSWAIMRESQSSILKYPNTGMAVTIDCGEAEDIHPQNKNIVGERLYATAKRIAYADSSNTISPVFDSFKIENNRIRIFLKTYKSKLMIRGNEPLKGFAIAGPDHKFYWAIATLENNSIMVSSPDVLQPIAARYAWGDNPECNLINTEGLPAAPFRTDEWDK